MAVLTELPQVFAANAAPRSTISDAVARGDVRRLARGLYTRNLVDSPEEVIRRNLFDVVSAVYPGALISDRSARIGARTTADGSLYLRHDRLTETELPGLTLRPHPGPAAIESDLPLPAGLHMSSVPRALLENASLTRGRRNRPPRTLTRPELEEWLESLIEQRGDAGFRALREQARSLALPLGMEKELAILDPLMGAILGTRTDVAARSHLLRARQKGYPFDSRRVELFESLFESLDRLAPSSRPVFDLASQRYRFLPFFEAYFSNYIEGTEFELDEAREIVFEHFIPPQRPADAHDIMGTYQLVSDHDEMRRVAATSRDFVALLRSRHRILLEGRPEKNPGVFKKAPNRVGGIQFVTPSLVEGTLREGFTYYRRLTYPFARAVFQMFLVSEVHPFDDGDGRVARVMMNAELVAASEHRIVIPQIHRNNYVMALRALSLNGRAEPLIRTLDFAQRYTAAIDFSGFDTARTMLEQTSAFIDPDDADARDVRLSLPDPTLLGEVWRIVDGPREYTGRSGADIDVGWAWEIEREGERRAIKVEVAGGRLEMADMPEESRIAIETRGRSAISTRLADLEPPEELLVTSSGVFRR